MVMKVLELQETSCHTVVSLMLNTYSDAKNVLTGVIDQPENWRKNSENFFKTVVWVLANYCKDRKLDNTKEVAQPVTIDLANQEVAMTTEALPATPPKKASFDKLLSNDDVQIPCRTFRKLQLPKIKNKPQGLQCYTPSKWLFA